MKKTLMAAGLAGAMASANSKAATMIVDEPELGTDYTLLDITMTNDDTGAVYNSGITNTTENLAQRIASLNSDTVSNVMSDWTYNLSGDVTAGWSLTPQTDGSVYSGTIAPFGNDEWSASKNQIQTLGIPLSQLEQNGNSTYDPFNLADIASSAWNPADYDPIVVLTGTQEANDLFNASNYNGTVPASSIENAFVGTSQSGFTEWSTNGPQYALINPNDFSVIPEPSTTGLVGLGLAAGLLYRRRKNASRVSFRDTGAATSGSQAA